jgi:Zn finger protein HypA/HybF involved in hydrogenase expression
MLIRAVLLNQTGGGAKLHEIKFLCKTCRNVFVSSVQSGSPFNKAIVCLICPQCKSGNVEEAPAWAPLGSGHNIFDSSEWEYECQQCRRKFKMPIPKSPTEAKGRICIACGSHHLQLLTDVGAQPLYCG